MPNDKEIESKAAAQNLGSKDASFSLQSIMSDVKQKTPELPGFQDNKKKIRPEKISNNAGFKLAPENKMIAGD